MANKKTSEEAAGGSLQKNDLIRIARMEDGNNYAVPAEEMLAKTVTTDIFLSLVANSELIPSMWYLLTDVPNVIANSTTNVYIQAIGVSEWNFVGITIQGGIIFNVYFNRNDISSNYKATDQFGNQYLETSQYDAVIDDYIRCAIPDYGYAGMTMTNTIFESSNRITINVNAHFSNCIIRNSIIEITPEYYFTKSTFIDSYVSDYNAGMLVITNSNFIASSLVKAYQQNNLNCFFSRVNSNAMGLYYGNGSNIDNLLISGAGNSFDFNGTYNNITNNWSGIVVNDENNAYSTITATLNFNATPQSGSYNSTIISIIDNAPIGIYKLNENATVSGTTYTISHINGTKSSIPIIIRLTSNPFGNKINFSFKTTRGSIVDNTDILVYHGATAKVGDLDSPNSYIKLYYKDYTSNQGGNYCYHVIPDSPHYD